MIKNQVSGVPWPDALSHLKAWLRARLALKFSLPGPYSDNGSPRSAVLPRNDAETAGKQASGDSRQRARRGLFPVPFGYCSGWWSPDTGGSSRYRGASSPHWCVDGFWFSKAPPPFQAGTICESRTAFKWTWKFICPLCREATAVTNISENEYVPPTTFISLCHPPMSSSSIEKFLIDLICKCL